MAVLERPVVLREPVFSPDARRFGLLAMAVAAGIMLLVVAGSGHEALFRSDADLFRRVATDPFGDGSAIAAPELYGTSYRYGRILFPFLGWALALGRAGWVDWTLPAVDLLGVGLLVAAAVELLRRRGRPAARVLVLAFVPALWLSMAIAYSEPLVIGLTLTALLLWEQRRVPAALVTVAFVLLAREVMALAFLPLVLGAVRRRAWREVLGWGLAGLPLLAWWTWVRIRVGSFPFLDPSISRREAMALPFTGMRRLVETGEARADMWIVFTLALATAAAAVVVWRRGPRRALAGAALGLGLLMTALGPNALRSSGEAVRVLAPAQVFVVLAAVTARPVTPVEGGRETLAGVSDPTDAHWFCPVARFLGPAYLRNAFTKGTSQEVEFLVRHLALRPGDAVLDVGCGPGRHARALAERGLHVTGVDLSEEFIALAREGAPDRATFLVGDARDLAYDREFDLVLSACQGAFGLLGAGDADVLTRMARAVRPGGRVVLDTFSLAFAIRHLEEGERFDLVDGVLHESAVVRGPSGDERSFDLWTTCYTPRELRLMAQRCGLSVESVSASTPGGWGTEIPDLEHPGLLLVARRPQVV